MLFGETATQRRQRKLREQELFPEIALTDERAVLRVDATRLRDGEEPTGFTRTAMQIARQITARRTPEPGGPVAPGKPVDPAGLFNGLERERRTGFVARLPLGGGEADDFLAPTPMESRIRAAFTGTGLGRLTPTERFREIEQAMKIGLREDLDASGRFERIIRELDPAGARTPGIGRQTRNAVMRLLTATEDDDISPLMPLTALLQIGKGALQIPGIIEERFLGITALPGPTPSEFIGATGQEILTSLQRFEQGSLGFFTGDNPAESIQQAIAGYKLEEEFSGEELGFIRNRRLFPEGSTRLRVGALIGEEFVSPFNLTIAAAGPRLAVLATRLPGAAGTVGKALVDPILAGGAMERMLGEVAVGVAARTVAEEFGEELGILAIPLALAGGAAGAGAARAAREVGGATALASRRAFMFEALERADPTARSRAASTRVTPGTAVATTRGTRYIRALAGGAELPPNRILRAEDPRGEAQLFEFIATDDPNAVLTARPNVAAQMRVIGGKGKFVSLGTTDDGSQVWSNGFMMEFGSGPPKRAKFEGVRENAGAAIVRASAVPDDAPVLRPTVRRRNVTPGEARRADVTALLTPDGEIAMVDTRLLAYFQDKYGEIGLRGVVRPDGRATAIRVDDSSGRQVGTIMGLDATQTRVTAIRTVLDEFEGVGFVPTPDPVSRGPQLPPKAEIVSPERRAALAETRKAGGAGDIEGKRRLGEVRAEFERTGEPQRITAEGVRPLGEVTPAPGEVAGAPLDVSRIAEPEAPAARAAEPEAAPAPAAAVEPPTVPPEAVRTELAPGEVRLGTNADGEATYTFRSGRGGRTGEGEITALVPDDVDAAITQAERRVPQAEKALDRASEARAKLPTGSSRARVTTANANASSAADGVAAAEDQLEGLRALKAAPEAAPRTGLSEEQLAREEAARRVPDVEPEAPPPTGFEAEGVIQEPPPPAPPPPRRVPPPPPDPIDPTSFGDAQDALAQALKEEDTLRRVGTAGREIGEGRVRQAAGVRGALTQGIREGLSGEELAAAARRGAATGDLRMTFAGVPDIDDAQRGALFDELARLLREKGDAFGFMRDSRALQKVLDGRGLQPREIERLRDSGLIDDEAVAWLTRRPRETVADLAADDAKEINRLRRELDKLDQRSRKRTLTQVEKLNARDVDARLRHFGEQLEGAGGIEFRALNADFPDDAADIFKARAEAEKAAASYEAKSLRLRERESARDIDRIIRGEEPEGAGGIEFRAMLAAKPPDDAADILKARAEAERTAISTKEKRLRLTERESIRDVDRKIRDLEQTRDRQIRESNRADALEIRRAEKWSRDSLRKQQKAETREVAAAYKATQNAKEALDRAMPNDEQLLVRARSLANGNVAVEEIIERWLAGNRAILDGMGPEGSQIYANLRATITGDTADSYLNAAMQRRMILAGVLRGEGIDEKTVQRMSDQLMEREFLTRFGQGFAEARKARELFTRNLREVVPGLADNPDQLRHAVDREISSRLRSRLGGEVIDRERRINRSLQSARNFDYNESLGGIEQFVQRWKNTQFGIADVAIFGVQGLTAIRRGGIQLLINGINKGLGAHMAPGAAKIYGDTHLTKQVLYALDGVHQGMGPSAVRATEGTLLSYLGAPGRALDRPVMRAVDALNRLQFGYALTAIRNGVYEGDLVMLHLLGQDVMDPAVRAAAAANANATGSFAWSAMRRKRASQESIALISPSMMRARVAQVRQMARVFEPTANVSSAERMMGAMMITSTVAYTLAVGKLLHDYIGIGDFEMDPSKPGFGLLTTVLIGADGRQRVIDVIPQDTVERAFARSIRELTEGDPVDAMKAWAKVFLGSASAPARFVSSAAGFGFEAGQGFKFGDLSATGRALNLSPLPPALQNIVVGQFIDDDAFDFEAIALDAIGLTNFGESATNFRLRVVSEQTGIPQDQVRTQLSRSQQTQALVDAGLLDEVEASRVETLQDRANRGDRTSQALLIGFKQRTELQRIADDSDNLAEYRSRRRPIMAAFAMQRKEYADVFDSFGDPKNPTDQLVGEWFALIDQASTGLEIDWDIFDRLEAALEVRVVTDPELGPAAWEEMMTEVNSVNPLDNAFERELTAVRFDLEQSQFFDIRDDVWAEIAQAFNIPGYDSQRDFRNELIREFDKQAAEQNIEPGTARSIANKFIDGHPAVKLWSEISNDVEQAWVLANLELAERALNAGYLGKPREAEEAALLGSQLAGATP